MKALITGHQGFIGRNFSKYLSTNGYTVRGVDIKSGLDCRDFFKTSSSKYDFIIHCAAVIGGKEYQDTNPLDVATNLSLDAEMFNWIIRTNQTCPIIYFSSSAAYPATLQGNEKKILVETDIDFYNLGKPEATYGWAKLSGEYLAKIANETYGKQVYVFRPFGGYGADQDLTYPFPAFIKRAVNREEPFVVWGSGEQIRDWIHINDIINGVMATVEAKFLEPVNLCTGIGTSFKELARLVTQSSGYNPEIICDNSKPEGVFYRVGNPSVFHSIYTPKISIENGIDRIFKKGIA